MICKDINYNYLATKNSSNLNLSLSIFISFISFIRFKAAMTSHPLRQKTDKKRNRNRLDNLSRFK